MAFSCLAPGLEIDANYHLSQLTLALQQKDLMLQQQCFFISSLQDEVALLKLSNVMHPQRASDHIPVDEHEPHFTNTKKGVSWARMAQGLWHADEARSRVGALVRCDSGCCDRLEEILALLSSPHDAIEAAHAYEALRQCPVQKGRHAKMWSSAALTLRNHLICRLCNHLGTCSFSSVEVEFQRIHGQGRIGSQGYDLDLRAQFYHSYDHLFPGFRETSARTTTKRRRPRRPRHKNDQIEDSSSGGSPDHEEPVNSLPRIIENVQPANQVASYQTVRAESEDTHSESGDSNNTAWNYERWQSPVPQRSDVVQPNDVALLQRLSSAMPSVAEEFQTPLEGLVVYARNCKEDIDTLGSILEGLRGFAEDFVETMRSLVGDFQGKALVECCAVLKRFAYSRHAHGHAVNDVIMLLLSILSASKQADDRDVTSASFDAILHICRFLEVVLGLSGGRADSGHGRLSDQVLAYMKEVLAPITKDGGHDHEELAIRILARSLPLEQVLQIISSTPHPWLIKKVLEEIFYTIRKAIRLAIDEDSVPEDKSWSRQLLDDVTKQRTIVEDSRCQLAWLRTGRHADYRMNQCVLIGLLFSPTMLVHMFKGAVNTVDENLMSTIAYALYTISNSFGSSIITLRPEECNVIAQLVLEVERHNLRRYCRTNLISLLGSILTRVSHNTKDEVLQLVVRYAKHFMQHRSEASFDYAVVWSVEQFLQNASSGCEAWSTTMLDICSDFIQKYDGYTWSHHALEVVKISRRVCERFAHRALD